MALDRLTDTELILIVVAVIYVYECAYWLPRRAVLFTSAWRRFRPALLADLVGNRRSRLAMTVPWPWATSLACETWPLSIGPRGLFVPTPETVANDKPGSADGQFFSFDELASVEHNGRCLILNGTVAVEFAFASNAERLAGALRKIARAEPSRRTQVIDQLLQKNTDTTLIADRLELVRCRTRALRLACSVFFVYTFAIGPLVYYLYPDVWQQVRWTYALSLLANWYLCIVVFYRTDRRLHPQWAARRRTHALAMLISPMTAMRSAEHVMRQQLSAFHPVAVAAAAMDADHFRSFAGCVLRDLRHSTAATRAAGDDAADTESWFRQRLRQILQRVATQHGADPHALYRPVEQMPDARSFCPRCLDQFVLHDGSCDRCGDLPLVRFERLAVPDRVANRQPPEKSPDARPVLAGSR